MDLLPAIDLRHGRVVRLRQGDDSRTTEYAGDPLAVAAAFAAAGARRIHVVDLDAALGEPPQRPLIARLAAALAAGIDGDGSGADDRGEHGERDERDADGEHGGRRAAAEPGERGTGAEPGGRGSIAEPGAATERFAGAKRVAAGGRAAPTDRKSVV